LKLKSKPGDFVVSELLREDYLRPRGRFRVYRVTKKKRTSLEAAGTLARLAGVPAGEIGVAGLKDRQGVTTQYMSVAGGKPVRLRTPELRIEPVGFAEEVLESRHSLGNRFEVTVRAVPQGVLPRIEASLAAVREHGLVNYFGEQRFGNLAAGQGWIARDLALGRADRALERLLCSASERDDAKNRKFKAALAGRWGDWRACREIAGVFGAHHSVFEHLARHPDDFAGAFRHVASRVRLIHLYAWQSHLWNRAVARYVEEVTPSADRISVSAPEGRLCFARGALAADPAMRGSFRLPGPRLDDVEHPRQRELLAQELVREGVRPEEFRIEGVPGFQLKGEDRELLLRPSGIRMSDTPRGLVFTFELARGAYALLVVQRLLAGIRPERRNHDRERPRVEGRRPAAGHRPPHRSSRRPRP
jgi:tRNA pseudouridine13 synthase